MKFKLRKLPVAAALAGLILILLPAVPALAITVVSSNPSSLGQGANSIDVVITGTGFNPTDTVSFSPADGITINSQSPILSTTQITVNLTIAANAPTTARNVVVTGGFGSTATCTGCFTVNAAPTITSMSPSALGQGATAVPVTFTGTGFATGISIVVAGGGVSVGTPTSLSSTSITAPVTVTSGAATTARNVTATNQDHGTATCASCVTINAGPTIGAEQQLYANADHRDRHQPR